MASKQQQFKLYLAPMRGLTDYIYRNTFDRHFKGIDAAVSPFIPSLHATRFKSSHLKDVLPQNNSGLPIIPQILGNSPDDFISLAVRLSDLGYETVNWNLGCPFPMVAKKLRGSGLLPYPKRIEAFLETVLPSIPSRLSIKIRLGRKTADDILRLMPIFNRYPLDEIVIHPRTGVQMYNGEPDLEMFERCLRLSDHRIVYNGDINGLETFSTYTERFENVDRWMVGRGVIANPFLPAVLKAGTDATADKVGLFRNFYDDLFDHYRQVFCGPGHLLGRMKGFWTYFARSFRNGGRIQKKIHRTQKLHRYMDIVERFFEEDAEWISVDARRPR